MTKTVIIIPTYNEAGNVVALIARIRDILPQASIFVVDDDSPDGTGDRVRELMRANTRVALLSRTEKAGLGKAYLHAFSEVLKDPTVACVVTMDADHSHDPAHLPPLLAALGHADVAIGSRYCRGGAMEGWELWRRLLSLFGNLYCRLVTGMPITDATAGFTAMSAEALRRVPFSRLDSSGYAYQIELKYLLWKSGARITEVPIVFRRRREGESKLSGHIIREGIIAPWKVRLRG